MIDQRLSEPTPKESPLYSRTFTAYVMLGHDEGETLRYVMIQFEGFRDAGYNRYYRHDVEFVFSDGLDVREYSDWNMEIRDQLQQQGFKNLDDL